MACSGLTLHGIEMNFDQAWPFTMTCEENAIDEIVIQSRAFLHSKKKQNKTNKGRVQNEVIIYILTNHIHGDKGLWARPRRNAEFLPVPAGKHKN